MISNAPKRTTQDNRNIPSIEFPPPPHHTHLVTSPTPQDISQADSASSDPTQRAQVQTIASNLQSTVPALDASETQTTVSGQLRSPIESPAQIHSQALQRPTVTYAHTPVHELYRSIPREIGQASRLIFNLLESVDRHEHKLSWPHTLNNFALTGATLLWIFNVRHIITNCDTKLTVIAEQDSMRKCCRHR